MCAGWGGGVGQVGTVISRSFLPSVSGAEKYLRQVYPLTACANADPPRNSTGFHAAAPLQQLHGVTQGARDALEELAMLRVGVLGQLRREGCEVAPWYSHDHACRARHQ